MKSIVGSKDYQEVLIMICENGRCNSVANAEWRSSSLRRYGRYPHSVSMMHLSERDFWTDTCAGKCQECRWQSSKPFECTAIAFVPSVHDLLQRSVRRQSIGSDHDGKATARVMRGARVCNRRLPRTLPSSRIRNKELFANWRSDSGTFTNALMH